MPWNKSITYAISDISQIETLYKKYLILTTKDDEEEKTKFNNLPTHPLGMYTNHMNCHFPTDFSMSGWVYIVSDVTHEFLLFLLYYLFLLFI